MNGLAAGIPMLFFIIKYGGSNGGLTDQQCVRILFTSIRYDVCFDYNIIKTGEFNFITFNLM